MGERLQADCTKDCTRPPRLHGGETWKYLREVGNTEDEMNAKGDMYRNGGKV